MEVWENEGVGQCQNEGMVELTHHPDAELSTTGALGDNIPGQHVRLIQETAQPGTAE